MGLHGRTVGVGGWKPHLLFNNSSVMHRCIQTKELLSRDSNRIRSLNYVWYHACYQQLLLTTQTLITKDWPYVNVLWASLFQQNNHTLGKKHRNGRQARRINYLFIKKRAHAFRSRTRFPDNGPIIMTISLTANCRPNELNWTKNKILFFRSFSGGATSSVGHLAFMVGSFICRAICFAHICLAFIYELWVVSSECVSA